MHNLCYNTIKSCVSIFFCLFVWVNAIIVCVCVDQIMTHYHCAVVDAAAHQLSTVPICPPLQSSSRFTMRQDPLYFEPYLGTSRPLPLSILNLGPLLDILFPFTLYQPILLFYHFLSLFTFCLVVLSTGLLLISFTKLF